MSNLHARNGSGYPVSCLCGLLGVSKQAYYKRDETVSMRRSLREEMIIDYVREVRLIDPGIGGIKLWRMYIAETGQRVGRDTFCSILYSNGLMLRQKPRHPRTTDSRHSLPVYPNLVRNFIPSAPNQLWVSDITYIELSLDNGTRAFCYLCLVQDAYSGKIVGWSVGATLGTYYAIEALRMAISGAEGGLCGLIHHSDRGSQYASREYVSLLVSNGISVSMTESGDPKENAKAERINGTIKNELLRGMKFRSVAEAREAVAKAVDFYNNRRPHMSASMMTPSQAADCEGELRKMWHSYREEAIKKRGKEEEIAEKGLPSPAVMGFLPGSALQSTHDRDKLPQVNPTKE